MVEELAHKYPNANYQIVPDQTHTGLLNAKDANGESVLLLTLREMLSRLSISTQNQLQLKYNSQREVELLNRHDVAFQQFLSFLGQTSIAKYQSERASSKLLSEYRKWRAEQLFVLFENADVETAAELEASNPRFFDAVKRRKTQALTEDGIYNWAVAILTSDAKKDADQKKSPTIQGFDVPWK